MYEVFSFSKLEVRLPACPVVNNRWLTITISFFSEEDKVSIFNNSPLLEISITSSVCSWNFTFLGASATKISKQ